jgi:hypothetical protein
VFASHAPIDNMLYLRKWSEYIPSLSTKQETVKRRVPERRSVIGIVSFPLRDSASGTIIRP